MQLYIKYMVSLRCKILVKAELEKLGLHFVMIELGMVEILEDISPEVREKLKENLLVSGLELMDDRKSILIDRVKTIIIEMIHHEDDLPKINYSDYISEKMEMDYSYL